MTRTQLYKKIVDDVTKSGTLPPKLTVKELERIVDGTIRWFHENYTPSVQRKYYIIPLSLFSEAKFKSDRTIKLPDCVSSVVSVKEVKGAGRLGTMDGDFSVDRMIASEIYLSPLGSDSLVYMTVMNSFWDLSKAFFLDTIAYDNNPLTKEVMILGRNPRFDVVIDTFVGIPEEKLFEDMYFIRYCRGKARESYGEILTFFDFPLSGGARINASEIAMRGTEEVNKVEQEINDKNQSSFFFKFH